MILRAAAAGALIAGIPLAGILYHEQQQMKHTAESLSYYEQLQEQYSHAKLYLLARDAVAGEILTADMFDVREIQSEENLSGTPAVNQEELTGKRLKVSLTKGTVLQGDLLYEGAPVAEDERLVEVRELYLPQTIREQEFVDIRIVFPNGEDYLVVGHKQVYRIIRDAEDALVSLQLRFVEQELLRYQAACVDVAAYQDTKLYALQYTGDYQPAAEVYYPVNPDVFCLMQWDPNIEELFLVDGEQERRDTLETHLERFLTDDPQAKTDVAAAKGKQVSADSPTGSTAQIFPEQVQDHTSEESEDTTEHIGETKEPLTLYTGLPQEP